MRKDEMEAESVSIKKIKTRKVIVSAPQLFIYPFI